MDVWEMIAILEGALAILIAGTWYWVLRQHGEYSGWRQRASLTALALPTLALVINLALATVVHLRPLRDLDDASLRGGWQAFGGSLWVWSLLATGPLSFCGLILVVVGKGMPRVAAAIWSFLTLGIFFLNLTLAVNSFHGDAR
jgi:hypothetical protein